MIKFRFDVSGRGKEAIVNHPKAVNFWVVINTIDQAAAFDDGVFMT
jgi:hypothetical protein